MKIAVFGASGKVGSLVVAEALRRGYEVVAFIHSHNTFQPHEKLTVVRGDVHVATDVVRAVQGSDAVVSCLGSWGTLTKDVLTAAMRAIIPAMHEHKIERIVTLTGSGASVPGTSVGFVHDLLLKLPLFGTGKVFADGEAHMRLLADSGLAWTTLRSPVMTKGGARGYHLDLHGGSPLATISRRAVAEAMLDQLQSDVFVGAAPIIHRAKHNSDTLQDSV